MENIENQLILGLDIGGTGIKAAIVNTTTGELASERFKIATPKPATPTAIADALKQIVQHFAWKGAIGCGFPSVIQQGIAQTAANIHPDWVAFPVQEFFIQTLQLPVTVINDADAAGIAEMSFGAGINKKGVVVLITIGTGLGSAVFHDGKLLPNSEFGHLFLNGKIAEKYASNSIREQEQLSWEDWGNRLNEYLNHLNRLLYPDTIILGGGVSKDYLQYKQYLNPATEVIPAQFMNRAGIIGAAMAAKLQAAQELKPLKTSR